MLRKSIMMAALLAASPALAQQQPQGHPPPHPPQALCEGRVVVETVRLLPAGSGFSYNVMLQNQSSTAYTVDVSFEGFGELARQRGITITIPTNTITMTVPAGNGSRSTEMQFGTISANRNDVILGNGVGVRYDSGPIARSGPAAVRLQNCRGGR